MQHIRNNDKSQSHYREFSITSHLNVNINSTIVNSDYFEGTDSKLISSKNRSIDTEFGMQFAHRLGFFWFMFTY